MPAQLPQFQNDDKAFQMMQNAWASILDPIVAKPIVAGLLLKDVALINGTTVVNHKLGRKLTGWIITRMQGAFGQVYDLQNTNQMTNLTLVLHSNVAVTCDLWVF